MALTGAKHEAIHGKTGDDLAKIKANFDDGKHTNLIDFEPEAAMIYQMQKMQDEINYLRTEISSNKDKTGTTSSERSRITANHSKVGITTSQASAITANTSKVGTNIDLLGGKVTKIAVTASAKAFEGGTYKLTFTMVDTNGRSPVTKTAIIDMS